MYVLEFTQGDAIGLREMNINDVSGWKKTIEQHEKIIQDTKSSIVIEKGKAEIQMKTGNFEAYESLMKLYIPSSKRLIESCQKCIADCENAILDSEEKIKGYDRALASGKLPLNYTAN